jgi:hypothetical protein
MTCVEGSDYSTDAPLSPHGPASSSPARRKEVSWLCEPVL